MELSEILAGYKSATQAQEQAEAYLQQCKDNQRQWCGCLAATMQANGLETIQYEGRQMQAVCRQGVWMLRESRKGLGAAPKVAGAGEGV